MHNPNSDSFISANYYKASPALMAEYLSEGKFKRYSHVDYIDNIITPAILNGGGRIVVSMPPRHGKSTLISLYTPAWYLSLYPERRIILTSYEAAFAATWGRQVRNLINDHSEALKVSISQDSKAADRWNTTQGGGMLTTGIGGPITGYGGNIICVDDPCKNFEEASSETYRRKTVEWFQSTLYTRAEPNATIILLMTRWHTGDLAGFLLQEHHDKWTEIKLPAFAETDDQLGRPHGDALCPERYDKTALNGIKQAVGPSMWAALYQQNPVIEGGNLFKLEMFCTVSLPTDFEYTVIFADTAYNDKQENDYTVFAAFGMKDQTVYVIDVLRERMKSADIEAKATEFIRNYQQSYAFRGAYIEPKGHGIYLNQIFPRRGLRIPSESDLKEFYADRKMNKVERANNAIPHLVGKKIMFSENIAIRDELISECLSFPRGKHDDFLDCLVDVVKYAYSRTPSILDVL